MNNRIQINGIITYDVILIFTLLLQLMLRLLTM